MREASLMNSKRTNMKKYIVSLLAVFAFFLTASAQHIDQLYTMHVTTVDGSTVDFEFADEPVMTFNGADMTISSAASADTKFQMDNVVSVTFSSVPSGIATVKDGESGIHVSVSDGKITVSGMAANAKVSVYDVGGALVASANADAGGQAVVNISNLGKGVFVVSTPANAFKFTK